MARAFAFLMLALLASFGGSTYAQSDFNWRLPPGVAPPPVPADNPMSAAKVALGRRLFYDADLSIDGTMSCGTCHEQHRGFTEGNATHPGVKDTPGRRNVMALANVGYFSPLTWANPALTSLEAQTLVPISGSHPVEMGMAGQDSVLVDRLAGDACYRRQFAAAFPGGNGQPTMTAITKAIAAFERTLISRDAPIDQARRGATKSAISPAARRGESLFSAGGLGCASCHAGRDFTDLQFHAVALPPHAGKGERIAGPDHGLAESTHDPRDEGRFRTPSLRNVAVTGPYFHDGSVTELSDAVRLHAPEASDADRAAILAFLDALTDRAFLKDPRFSLPKPGCR